MKRVYSFSSSMTSIALFSATVGGLSACSSAPKVLSVRSFPAEADVCLKGKLGSSEFDQKLMCVGQTPFEADHVDITDAAGKKRRIDFNDLKPEESFFLIVRKDGYDSESVQVPSWEQFLHLRKEVAETQPQISVNIPAVNVPVAAMPATPAPIAAPLFTPNQTSATKSLRILSSPLGALVYINGSLQGNTPFVYQYPTVNQSEHASTGVSVKLEAAGFASFERTVNLNQVDNQEISFQLEKTKTESARLPASESVMTSKKQIPETIDVDDEETEASTAAPLIENH
jgi:hypothetical protein